MRLSHQSVDVAEQKLWAIVSIAYSTLRHAFRVGAENPTVMKREIPRIVRNQIAIRGSQIAGRALTTVGASALGYSVVVSNKPLVTNKTPLPMTKRTFKREARLLKGSSREYGSAKQYSFAKPGMSDRSTAHYRAGQKKPEMKRKIKVGTLRGAGTLAVASGKVVPMLGYGYVAGQYIDPTAPPEKWVDVEGISRDLSYVHSLNMAQIGQAVASARMVYYTVDTLRRQIIP